MSGRFKKNCLTCGFLCNSMYNSRVTSSVFGKAQIVLYNLPKLNLNETYEPDIVSSSVKAKVKNQLLI